MKTAIAAFLLVILAGATWAADFRRDPLTDAESDQLRELAQSPLKRLALMLKFAHARMDALEQLRADPKAEAERGRRSQRLLEDIGNILDELNDNIDNYAERHDDLRKALQSILEANTEFQARLTALKQAGGPGLKDYGFTLDTAIDSSNSLGENARKTLEEQAVLAKQKQLKKAD